MAVLDLYILIQERWLGFSEHMLTLSVSVWMLLEAPEYLKKKKKKGKNKWCKSIGIVDK